MTKANYKAWEVLQRKFPKEGGIQEQIKFLLHYGILAPSGHNSQPWKFEVRDNILKIYVNMERSLTKSDPLGRQLSLAFGAFVENLLIAGKYFGLIGKLSFSEGIYDPIEVVFNSENRGNTQELNSLFLQIPNRVTNRFAYKKTKLPEEFINQCINFSTESIQINIFTEQKIEQRVSLAKVLLNSQIEAMESGEFRNELSEFIISNYSSKKVGMPGFALDIPGIVSLFVPKLIKKINFSKLSKKKDEKLLMNFTPAIGVISADGDSRNYWINTGMIFQRCWLLATSFGLCFSPMAAATQSPNYAEEVKKITKIDNFPLVLFRLGFPNKKAAHSPRINPEELLI